MGLLRKIRSFMQLSAQNRAESGRRFVDSGRDLLTIARRGFYPSEYYRLSMYEGVPPDYLSIRDYTRIEKILNPRQTGVVNFDKWHQYCFFKGLGLPTPEVFGFVSGKRGMLARKPFSGDCDALLAMLDTLEKPVVVKPFGGGHGRGFDLILESSRVERSVTLKKSGTIDADKYLRNVAEDPEGLIFQQHVRQHPDLAALSPNAVNTLRILTALHEDGSVEFPAVILKMARGASLVDNVGAGGIAAHVNPETGLLGPGFVWPGKETYRNHPDTGAPIERFAVPFWRESLALAALAHQNLTSARALGWDVAVTRTGPMLIEMNGYVAIPVFQRLGHSVSNGLFGEFLRQSRSAATSQ